MSRRLPLCALCGGTLRLGAKLPSGDRVRSVFRKSWERMPGRPEVGWHLLPACDEQEPEEIRQLIHRESVGLTPHAVRARLNTIHDRGEGRLVAGKRWWTEEP